MLRKNYPTFPIAEEEEHQAEEAMAPIKSPGKLECSRGDSLKAGRIWDREHFPRVEMP